MLQYAYRDFMRQLDSVVSSLCNYQIPERSRKGRVCIGVGGWGANEDGMKDGMGESFGGRRRMGK